MTAGGDLFFADTNLLLYDLDTRSPAKRQAARNWLDAVWGGAAGRLSWQVLNEFYVNATAKLGTPPETVRSAVRMYATWRPVGVVDYGIVERAWHWMDRAGTAWWDALILASAEAAGCRYLLSEDFQHGRKYGRVEVVNPFLDDPKRFFAQ